MSADIQQEWPLWEVFVRSKAGLDHKHCGSLHAPDPKMAIQMARDVYTRRQEGSSIWVVRSDQIVASDPGDRTCSSIRRRTRCTATRRSIRCPSRWTTCETLMSARKRTSCCPLSLRERARVRAAGLRYRQVSSTARALTPTLSPRGEGARQSRSH
jgi:ring-1,2-phenylacetyl-CoA epoxidase subunit PaaB